MSPLVGTRSAALLQSPKPLLQGLVAYYRLEEASGVRYPAVGSAALTDNNSTTQGTGIQGKCAAFASASTQYLSVADGLLLSMGNRSFTIACWAQTATAGAGQTILSKYTNAGGAEYRLSFAGTNIVRWEISADGTALTTVDDGTAISINTWYFIVAGFDASSGLAFVQVNNGTINTGAHAGGAFLGGTTFRIGARFLASVANTPLNGLVDEVGIWKKLMPAGERTALYGAGLGHPWPLA